MAASRARGLVHPTRRRIYRHVLLLPGDHFRSIARSLNLGVGTASHHIGVLVREGALFVERRNGRCRYYARGDDAEPARNQLYMKHWDYRDLRLRIAMTVVRRPNVTAKAIARHVGISRQLASYHLSQLRAVRLVRRENGGYVADVAAVNALFGLPRN